MFGCSMDYLLDDEITDREGIFATDNYIKKEQSEKKFHTKRTIGFSLLIAGLCCIVLGALFSLVTLLLGIYIAVCGILTLLVKRRAWLWIVIWTVILVLFGGLWASANMISYERIDESEATYLMEE